MNLFSEKNIPKLIILTPIITAVLIAFFVINFFIQTQNDYFEKESYRLEDIFLTNQKKLLEKELNKVIHYIEHHVKNSANLSEAELKKQLIQYIETIRYGQDGYIWIHDTTYFLIAHPFRPDSINTYDIDLQDAMDTFITKKFVDETIKHPKGTFIEYYWQKPKDVHFSPKLGFFKLYEKYNWVIGTGLYITDIEKSIYQSKKLLEKRIDDYIQVVVSISAFIIFIFGILSYMISNKINKVLTQYRQNVKRKELLLEDLNKNLERKVQIAIKEIQDKDKAMIHQSRLAIMGSMLSMIAHQWRQPLSKVSAILMELETATKFGKSNDAMLIQSIEESNKHLSYMSYTIDDFKNFFQPDKQKVEFHVQDACNEAISLIDAALKSQGITCIKTYHNHPNILGYEREFAQVILNILSNAKDALKHNNIKNPSILLNIHMHNDTIVITIEDNALGIATEHIDRIFEPYFTTKETLKGTGLGLYISKMIIEQNMGGKLYAENINQGARFTITLEKVSE